MLRPGIVALLVLILVILGAGIVQYGETTFREDRSRELSGQAKVLAAITTAALSFDDRQAAAEYTSALSTSADIRTAALYDENGQLFASFTRGGEPAPTLFRIAVETESTLLANDRLVVAEPVMLDGLPLGTVVLEATLQPPERRLIRYAFVLLLTATVLLAVAVLAVSRRALRATNDELATANDALRAQIAERERAEAALRQAQKMEAIGQLTGGLAHDFNNLLQIVMLSLSALSLRAPIKENKETMSRIQMALNAVERGATLTRQLLAFSRRQPLAPRSFDMNPLVEQMCKLIERTLGAGIQVVWRPGEDLWPVTADPHQLDSALLNLAVNARDAMPTGGKLTLTTGRLYRANDCGDGDGLVPGHYAWISVSDTGTGMAPEVKERALEPFFSTKEVGKGTGLGLSQVYGYAKQSGGDLVIDSVPGTGTTVTLLLPCSPGRADPDNHEEQALPRPLSVPNAKTVLLVEDDDMVLETTRAGLQELGYRVLSATDAESALTLLAGSEAVDILFSDVVMPGRLNGIELAQEARRAWPALKILLTSGYPRTALSEYKGEAFDMPILAKPYSVQDLSTHLSRL